MLQNSRVTAFTVSELLRENQQGGGGGGKIPSPIKIRVKFLLIFLQMFLTIFLGKDKNP